MTVTFVRIDDRMIHGQTVTRWAKEYPCDGLIAVNDAAAANKVLTQAYKGASDKKTFVWSVDDFSKKSQKVLDSDTRYFVITKNPIDMKKLLVDQGFVPGNIKEIIIGPANDRPGAIKLGNNQSITKDEAAAIEEIESLGYRVKFQLLPDVSIGYWSDFKNKFGY
ncbi:PTS system mannose/fructose/N-acetylgalactosamine-transporter subunit IIB [Streptococcus uberis]|uniref:PTS system mannose/fructose/N-acetylgalactosamine-transporter subunit IIB n=1 Tax=Streptococcus uberis TaxID=1349 RepID=UPI000E017EF1|nr:PTS sugar transporter subunit IIB [Streptococcus uberis]MCK1191221.1 PTS sugar transporter subunit IIB [Streptococcus uberis]MCK1209822.1 PTS sugar transporter subunit IIB [Streptococcus uberis]MCR4253782.1 PTS sugar transporter subunit IIB [Streptococcus uberis]MCR4255621.1 PTS sugar transporter subunit IIB [Streptococcus uberis]MCR4260078.1 PTS sugar transporter subunit IIB [Streptococcus uberis]